MAVAVNVTDEAPVPATPCTQKVGNAVVPAGTVNWIEEPPAVKPVASDDKMTFDGSELVMVTITLFDDAVCNAPDPRACRLVPTVTGFSVSPGCVTVAVKLAPAAGVLNPPGAVALSTLLP